MRRTRYPKILFASCFLALCAGAPLAFAAPGGGSAAAEAQSADPMTTEAKARFKEGLELYKAHKNEAARTKYLQALALSQAAAIYLNLAVVEYDLMLYPDALKHAKAYAVHPKAEPAKVDKLKKEMIPELQAKTGHVAVQGQAGEAVFVDGEKIGIAPLADTVDVTPGSHTVACGTITKNVTVNAGDSATVIVIVENAPTPSATTPPPPASSTAPNPSPSASQTPPPQPPPDQPPKEEGGKGKWVGPIVLGVVGVGGMVTGAVFAGNSNSAHDDATAFARNAGGHPCAIQTSATCNQYSSKISDNNSDRTIAIVGYTVGGVALAGGAVWAAINVMRKSDSPPASGKASTVRSSLSLTPFLAPGGGGATVGFALE